MLENNLDSVEQESVLLRTLVILAMIALAAALRIGPHPWNFQPVGAMALFGGATIKDRRLACLFPVLGLFAGDLVIGFHKLMLVVYASFVVNVALGYWIRHCRTALRISGVTLLGAMQFFLVTNFAVWISSAGTYPKTTTGLVACYAAGIPFFWNMLAGDAFYAVLLFGGLACAERMFPVLRETAPAR